MRNLVLATATGLAAGAALGYAIATKRLKGAYLEIAEREIAKARQEYVDAMREKLSAPPKQSAIVVPPDPDWSNNSFAVAQAALTQYQGVKPPLTEVVRNVFTDAVIPEEDVLERDPSEPYIISQEEYDQGATDFKQVSLMYYAGDDVLAEEDDSIVPEPDEIVGEGTLQKFGTGTKDPNAVYVRNQALNLDFEVIRVNAKYSVNVQGFPDEDEPSELRHSMGRSRRAFDDD